MSTSSAVTTSGFSAFILTKRGILTTSSSRANLFMINHQLAVQSHLQDPPSIQPLLNAPLYLVFTQSSSFYIWVKQLLPAVLFLISRRLVQRVEVSFSKKSFPNRSVDPACLGLPTRLTGSGVTGGAAEAAPALLLSLSLPVPPSWHILYDLVLLFIRMPLMFPQIGCLALVAFQKLFQGSLAALTLSLSASWQCAKAQHTSPTPILTQKVCINTKYWRTLLGLLCSYLSHRLLGSWVPCLFLQL